MKFSSLSPSLRYKDLYWFLEMNLFCHKSKRRGMKNYYHEDKILKFATDDGWASEPLESNDDK